MMSPWVANHCWWKASFGDFGVHVSLGATRWWEMCFDWSHEKRVSGSNLPQSDHPSIGWGITSAWSPKAVAPKGPACAQIGIRWSKMLCICPCDHTLWHIVPSHVDPKITFNEQHFGLSSSADESQNAQLVVKSSPLHMWSCIITILHAELCNKISWSVLQKKDDLATVTYMLLTSSSNTS